MKMVGNVINTIINFIVDARFGMLSLIAVMYYLDSYGMTINWGTLVLAVVIAVEAILQGIYKQENVNE